MNERTPLERLVAGWMADEAAGSPEPLLERILATTARTTPQPAWRARLAEPTMRGRSGQTAIGLRNRGLAFATIALLLLAAFVALVVGATLLRDRPPAPSSDDWPGFRGDATRSGVATQGPVGNPVTLWTAHVTGAVLEVSVIGDRVFFASDDGRLHALSRDGGVEAWAVAVAEPPLSGPFAADGRLYLSDASGRFVAFSQADGALIWASTTTYAAPSRAISADGTLYFGTGDGSIVAMDGATGTERWRVQLTGAMNIGAPAIGGGRIYAGTDGAGFVAVDLDSHQVAWTGDTTGEKTGSASVIDGIAYIGTNADPGSVGTLHAFDAATGARRWTAADPFLGLPTVSNGVTYSASTHGLLAAIDTTTGRSLWSVQLEGDLRSPVVVGDTVFVVASGAHRIYAVDAARGDELWAYDLEGTPNCCLSVARGAVFVGDQSGAVYAIGGDGATIVGRPFASVPVSPGPTSSPSDGPTPTPVPSIATLTWSTDLQGMGIYPISQIAVDPQGRIWAPEAAADRIAIFDASGTLIEEWGESGDLAGQFDFTRGNGDGYGTLAFASDGSFYVLDVGNRRVQRFDAQRRSIGGWGSFGDGPRAYTDPIGIAVAPDDTVWVLDNGRAVVEHYTADGTVIGSFDPTANATLTNGMNSLAIDRQGNVYVTMGGPLHVAMFEPDGEFVRFIGEGDFDEQPTHMAIDDDGRLFVTQGPERGAAFGVLAFAADGSPIGGFGPVGDGDGELNFPAGIALDGASGIYVEDSMPETPRLMRFELPEEGAAP